MNQVETYEHKGVAVRILYDEHATSPRDADNLCEMHINYRGYTLGDTQLPDDGLPEIDCPRCDGTGEHTGDDACQEPGDCERCLGSGQAVPTLPEWLAHHKAVAAMPLFVYEHSGLSIQGGKFIWLDDKPIERDDTRPTNRFSEDTAGWDTSFVGVMFVTRERVIELCGDEPLYQTPGWLAKQFEAEIEEYDRYLRGEVYGYIAGEDTPFEDSCWGFIGFDCAKREASESAEDVAQAIAGSRCTNCTKAHTPQAACILQTLAAELENRLDGESIPPQFFATIDSDEFWSRFGGPALDRLQRQYESFKEERDAGSQL